MNNKPLGYCVGVLKPNEITFTSLEPPNIGQFVIVEYYENGEPVSILGMVKSIERYDRYIWSEDHSPQHIETLISMHDASGIFKSNVMLLGRITDKGLETLRYPPKPASPVFPAPKETLRKIFSDDRPSYIEIGNLMNFKDVPVYIDLDQIVSRHLAVLAVTGGGKSNAVSVILEEIAKKRGTVIVVDVHGEYENAEYTDDRGRNVVNLIDVKINLSELSADEIATLCGIDFERSGRQYYVIQRLVECVRRMRSNSIIRSLNSSGMVNPFEDVNTNQPPFIDDLLNTLERLIEEKSRRGDGRKDEESVEIDEEFMSDTEETIRLCSFARHLKKDELIGTHIRLSNLKTTLGDRIDDNSRPIIDCIKLGSINVLKMKELDNAAVDVILSHLLYNLLMERKKAIHFGPEKSKIPVPVVVVIEEAHIFAPYDSSTRTKYALAKVSREARKFGLGIILVSQRPKGLDSNILSQMNNWIILRIVEPEDQRHVQRASETLSAELMDYLPALNPGEAILLGPFVKIPLLVKFRKSTAKKAGSDISAVEEWNKYGSRV